MSHCIEKTVYIWVTVGGYISLTVSSKNGRMTLHLKVKSYDLPFILAAQQLIDNDPSRNLTISDLATEIGINTFKLKKGFKTVVKQTIHQYRLGIRLNLAKDLLESTDHTIEEIAYKVGFDSRDGFANAFRREFKRSPRSWRKGQLQEDLQE